MSWRRKPRAKPDARRRESHAGDDKAQLSVPGYGSPPVTKPLGSGPQPSAYGLPPDVEDWPQPRDR